MSRTTKEATVGRYHYTRREELQKHLHAFLMACNIAERLKTLKGKSPYEFINSMKMHTLPVVKQAFQA
jgi:hypothetical protein